MGHISRRSMLLAATATLLLPGAARADLPDTIKIGILNDQSGPFADHSGKGSVVAAQLAVEDFGKTSPTPKVELLYADHQNKPDVGSAVARQWVDRDGVHAVTDVPNSAVGLAVNEVMRQRNRTYLAANVATSDLTGVACSPDTVQWTTDTWAMANAPARAITEAGGTTWFFIQVDYALGAAIVRDATDALKRTGATVVGVAKHPLGQTDFSSLLLQAQSSGAKVLAFATSGADLVNALKQAKEFGLDKQQTLVSVFAQLSDIDALGLDLAGGLLVTDAFYWDLNDDTRAFARRFGERMAGRMPTQNHAGVYSSVLAYLHALPRAASIEGDKVVAAMQAQPIDDKLFGPTTIRQDGRAVHAMHVFRVKQKAQSKSRWDLYDLVQTIPADQAFRPMAGGGCPLVRS